MHFPVAPRENLCLSPRTRCGVHSPEDMAPGPSPGRQKYPVTPGEDPGSIPFPVTPGEDPGSIPPQRVKAYTAKPSHSCSAVCHSIKLRASA
jgi:hypothetical protein